jgi:hypothetical protein
VFDDDGLIPAFGFGDKQTQDKSVFPFFPGTLFSLSAPEDEVREGT